LKINLVSFQALKAVSMKVAVVWNIAPCRSCPKVALMMEAVSISATSVNFYETTWCSVPYGCHFDEQLDDLCFRTNTVRFAESGGDGIRAVNRKPLALPQPEDNFICRLT
jgi:hypothetical protein